MERRIDSPHRLARETLTFPSLTIPADAQRDGEGVLGALPPLDAAGLAGRHPRTLAPCAACELSEPGTASGVGT